MDRPVDDEPFRGEVRLSTHRRVSHGVGLVKRDDLTAEEEFIRELRAYLLVLPPSAVFTHLTAARLLGWQLPRLPEQVPVFVAVDQDDLRPRRHGLIVSRLVRERDPIRRMALPVESAEEILLRMARDLGLIDLIVLVDSALRIGDLDPARMKLLLATGRPGVRMLREAWDRCTGKAESGGETLLQQFHLCLGIEFEPQFEVYDDHGQFVARVDLLVAGTTMVHEYDGAYHRGKVQHRSDLRRERRLAETPYTRRGFVLDDLLNHASVVMHEIDRALGRPHDLRRLRRWQALIENSMYSETGRERVINRWRRQNGIHDWSRTA